MPLVLIPILAAKESRFAKYHANQGLVLFGVYAVLGMAITFMSIILSFIPPLHFAFTCLSCLFVPVVVLSYLAFVIMGILNAVNGQMKPLPLFPKITIIK